MNPGYKHIIIQPRPGGGLTYAKARLESMYGPIESGWKLDGKTITVDIEIPPNTSAILRIPSASAKDLLEGGRQVKKVPGILAISQDADAAVISVGSGRYSFQFGK